MSIYGSVSCHHDFISFSCVAWVAGLFLGTLPSTEAISLPDSYPALGPGTLYLEAVTHEETDAGQQTSQQRRYRRCPSF